MVPSPGWKEKGWEPKGFIPWSVLVFLKVSRLTAQVSIPGKNEAANDHPITLAPAQKSVLSASSANQRASNGPESKTEGPR